MLETENMHDEVVSSPDFLDKIITNRPFNLELYRKTCTYLSSYTGQAIAAE